MGSLSFFLGSDPEPNVLATFSQNASSSADKGGNVYVDVCLFRSNQLLLFLARKHQAMYSAARIFVCDVVSSQTL